MDCRGPAFDYHNGRMLCTGKGAASSGPPFVVPGAHNEIRLPDRVLEVQGVSNQFCSISPDGRQIVTGQLLPTGESDSMHLVISDLDGSKAREIFRPPKSGPVWAMSWASRADLIAFTVGPQFAPDDAVVDVWTVLSDGSNPTNLTQGKFRNNAFPDLTADGKELVFRSTRDGNKQLYLMNSDGTNVRRITTDPANDTMPSISPNGDMIVFSSNRAYPLFQLYLQRLKNDQGDGGPSLFQKDSPSMHVRFSPDGKWVAFASGRGWLNDEARLSDGNGPPPFGEIFVEPMDGKSEPIRLTHNKWTDSLPCWGVMPPSSVGANASRK